MASVTTTADTTKEEKEEPLLSVVETLRFEIQDFANLTPPPQIGECYEKGVFKRFNLWWYLYFYPTRDNLLPFDFICCNSSSTKVAKIDGIFRVGPTIYKIFERNNAHWECIQIESGGLGRRTDTISNHLNNEGNLIIEVYLRIYKTKCPKVWYPKKQQPDLEQIAIAEKIMDSSVGADVMFSVGEKQTKFHAHKCFLIHRAPILYGLVKDVQGLEDVVEIPNVTEVVFKFLLRHIYTGEVDHNAHIPWGNPEIDQFVVELKNDNSSYFDFIKEILSAANRYGCIRLKLYIESFVTNCTLFPENAADWLLLADSISCPLLLEGCMDICSENLPEVKSSPGWAKVMESPNLLVKVLDYVTNKLNQPEGDEESYDNLRVGKLREKLESLGLDLDGTKEMLVQRLKDHDDDNADVAPPPSSNNTDTNDDQV